MSMRERKSQILMRWRIDRIKREDDVMGNILGMIFLNENLVTGYLPCVRVHRVHVSPSSSRESSTPISPSSISLSLSPSFLSAFHPLQI